MIIVPINQEFLIALCYTQDLETVGLSTDHLERKLNTRSFQEFMDSIMAEISATTDFLEDTEPIDTDTENESSIDERLGQGSCMEAQICLRYSDLLSIVSSDVKRELKKYPTEDFQLALILQKQNIDKVQAFPEHIKEELLTNGIVAPQRDMADTFNQDLQRAKPTTQDNVKTLDLSEHKNEKVCAIIQGPQFMITSWVNHIDISCKQSAYYKIGGTYYLILLETTLAKKLQQEMQVLEKESALNVSFELESASLKYLYILEHGVPLFKTNAVARIRQFWG